jgi:hypothetical protein
VDAVRACAYNLMGANTQIRVTSACLQVCVSGGVHMYVSDTCWVCVRVISACLQVCVSGGVHMYVTLVGCRYVSLVPVCKCA